MEKGKLFSYSWHIEDNETDKTIIRIYGLNERNENVCLRVENFKPYVYLELPSVRDWDETNVIPVISKINEYMREKRPENYKLEFKKKSYYANIDKKGVKKLFPYLWCSFPHTSYIKTLLSFCRKPVNIPGVGYVKFKVHEHNASPILQLTSLRNIPTAGWISFVGKRVKSGDPEKQTYCKYEYKAGWTHLEEFKSTDVARPLLMGYDIEVNSTDPTSMPKAKRCGDRIFQISCVLLRQGDKAENSKKYLLSLGKPEKKIVGETVEVLCFDTETELLEGFKDFIQKYQPNILIGYNIFTFDIPYMLERSETEQATTFAQQCMTIGRYGIKKSIKWSSSAYKNQCFEFLDCEGRIFVDLLPLVKRDYKMSNYKLSTIASHFLKGITKDPLDAKGIFRCYRLGMKGGKKGNKAMGIVGKYCVKDSELVVRLFETLTTWIALCEMSKVTNVPIFALYTQGQQLKVFSNAYRKCTNENIVVENEGYVAKPDDHYVGATVFPPKAGLYNKVVPFDFASLYPSSIIAYNISWDTLVADDDPIPDKMCHVMEWEDHIGCSHDPREIRKVELNNIIKGREEELKKLRYERDLKSNKDIKEEIKLKIERILKETKPYREERSNLQKSKNKHIICAKRKYRWIKSPKGILPEILSHLLDTRANTKKEMKTVKAELKALKEGTPEYMSKATYLDVLDQRQLALKVSANSGYGCLGVVRGYLPLMPGAMCTTYKGRKAIEEASESIQKDWGGVLVYGDSVSGDTPILVRYSDETINIQTIDTLGKEWIDYDCFKSEKKDLYMKEQSACNLEVWTHEGWKKINRVIRHKTNKKIYRVLTHTGCVDVTEDHSLLRDDKSQVKPGDVKIGDTLLHSFPKEFVEYDAEIVEGVSDISKIKCRKCSQQKPNYEINKNGICKQCQYYMNHKNKNVRPYFSAYEYTNKKYKLTREEAFVWGFFMADGSGGHYDCGKNSWAINNQNLDYLNRAKLYLEKVEPDFSFKILDTMESSSVYKLVAIGKVKLLAEKYHRIMYDHNKYKIVPYPILNASREIKEWFFEGYYTGDGYKPDSDTIIPKNGCVRMDCKGKIGTQGLYLLLKSIGYDNVSINTRETKPNIFRINGTKNKMRKSPIAIKKNILLSETSISDYVYDLETDIGVFQAGIGELMVKNTDSNYVNFPHLKTAQECWDYSIKVAKEVSKKFPPPMSLAYEEKIYWTFFILTKKRYMSLACERDGVLDTKISKKGVLLQRRDNSNFVRNVYGDVVMMIFQTKTKEEIVSYILDKLNELCGGVFKPSEFVITKSVGDTGDLQIREVEDEEKKKIVYKVGDYKVKPLPENKTQREKQFKLKECEDEKTYYLRCLPAQAQLAEKMRNRGQLVSAGSRIEYLITTTGGHTAKQYTKVESIEYFEKHSGVLSIDYLYYLKQLANPLDQILYIMYGESYKTFTLEQYKLRLLKNKICEIIKSYSMSKLVFKN
jgi:DNA polymerase elongation subunit (family B)